MIDAVPLTSLLDANRIGILDGGLATYLEDGLGFDLSKGPLWSARLLDESQDDVSHGMGQRAIRQAHSDYLDAGAELIGTATYQASHESFLRAGYTAERADELMTLAVQITSDALAASSSSSNVRKPLVSLSLGPYGSALSNGAEYTGDYLPTYLPDSDPRRYVQPTLSDLRAFHLRRLQTFVRDRSAWDAIGVVALETVPRTDEGIAFRLAMEDLAASLPQQQQAKLKPYYVSYAFPDEFALPWPHKQCEGWGPEQRHADADREMEELLYGLLAVEIEDQGEIREAKWPVSGVGINCTKPYLMAPLAQRMTRALQRLNAPLEQGGKQLAHQRKQAGLEAPLLFLYPDGGLVYDAFNKVWLPPTDAEHSNTSIAAPSGPTSWAHGLFTVAQSALSTQPDDTWAGVFVGGCCKSGTSEIQALCLCR
ncbi:AdoMet-homocysteine methyltransferase [Thecaphora frezii]